ncbi:MAG: glutathione S-transferase [Proteobacteria bacterium]|nr:glutathione S-transferase [Pseudomonadota bacterium]
MQTQTLRILGRTTSINVRKVLWLCVELDVPVAQEDWGGDTRPTSDPAFLALNPNGLVPVMQDGDFVLWESNTICRYLALRERRADLLPVDAAGRARVEQWMDWQATDLNSAWRYAFLALVRRSPRFDDPAAIAASVADWNRLMRIFEAQLERTGAYAAGPAFTLADINMGLGVQRWFAAPIERPTLPAVAAYYERLATREGYRLHGRNGMP